MLNHYSTHQHKGHNMVVAVTGDSYYKLSDGLATSVGKSELCSHTWDTKRLLGVHFQAHRSSTWRAACSWRWIENMDCSRNRMRFGGWVNLSYLFFCFICFYCWRFAGGMETRNHPYIMCAGEDWYKTKSLTVWFMKIGIGIALILLLLVASRRTFMTR